MIKYETYDINTLKFISKKLNLEFSEDELLYIYNYVENPPDSVYNNYDKYLIYLIL